jgi:hypothetical protein
LFEGQREMLVLFVRKLDMKLLVTSTDCQITVSFSLAGLPEKRVKLFGFRSEKDRVE